MLLIKGKEYKNMDFYYSVIANQVIDSVDQRLRYPNVLKTDCFNEYQGRPAFGGIPGSVKRPALWTLLELDHTRVQRTREVIHDLKDVHCSIAQGDIRNTKLNDNAFDVILDFSTIDHIMPQQMCLALAEYYRMLKHSGIAVVIVWLKKGYDRSCDPVNYDPTKQYYCDPDQFHDYIDQSGFRINSESGIFYNTDTDSMLTEFMLRKF